MLGPVGGADGGGGEAGAPGAGGTLVPAFTSTKAGPQLYDPVNEPPPGPLPNRPTT